MRRSFFAALLAILAFGLASSSAQASSSDWRVESLADTSTTSPNAAFEYSVDFTNEGPPTDGSPIVVTAQLPAGMTATQVKLRNGNPGVNTNYICSGATTIVCTVDEAFPHYEGSRGYLKLRLTVEVGAGLSGTLTAHFAISGGGAPEATTVDPILVSAEAPPFGIDAFDAAMVDEGAADTIAASHPEANLTYFAFNTVTDPNPVRGIGSPVEEVRDGITDLPLGQVGDPSVLTRCTLQQVSSTLLGGTSFVGKPECPPTSQVGTAMLRIQGNTGSGGSEGLNRLGPFPVFNIVPPPGAAARFGFNVSGVIVLLEAKVRSGGGYHVAVGSTNNTEALALDGFQFDFWGDPASPTHDTERACPGETDLPSGGGLTAPAGCPDSYTRPEQQSFLRNPTSCVGAGAGILTSFHADSWVDPGAEVEATSISHEAPGYPYPRSEWGPTVGIEGCEAEPFSPSFSAIPTTPEAGAPAGLDVNLRMPQQGLTEPQAISESDLKSARVTLPEGMRVNPAAASGLGACSLSQIGFKEGSSHPFEFSEAPQSCPESSKVGNVELESPLLARYDGSGNPVTDSEGRAVPEVLDGAVYLAKQTENPFGSLLAMYLVVEDEKSGLVLKLPGKIEADPSTGRLTTVFDENPQLPFENLRLHLFGGPRAALENPPTCGEYSSQATLAGWSGKAVEEQSSFTLEKGPSGGACPAGSFSPKLSSGTQNPLAGAFSPYSLELSREDGTVAIDGLTAHLPEGLLASLRGVGVCPDSVLASFAREADGEPTLGTGAAEEARPSCPSSSLLGPITVGAGPGPDPFYSQSGHLYFAGPYKGAPYSLAAVVPAVAGPFDLGNVVVRNAVRIDPETAQVTVESDPLPTILHGIPLDLKDLRINVNRPEYTINPTSCEPLAVNATIAGVGGRSANLSNRYQVTGCAVLPFRPTLSLQLKGGSKRSSHPALKAVLTAKPGEASVAKAVVALPHSEFLAQEHIKTICTRVQFAANECPAGSIYGRAKAWSPLLNYALEGPVYLRSSSHNLPDLVVALRGPAYQPLEIDLDGRIDSINGGIRNSFEVVPDAPVSKFILEMQGGAKGLLVNSENLCSPQAKTKATVELSGHNGKAYDSKPALQTGCKRAKGGRRRP